MAICELNHIHKSFGDKVIFEDYSLRVNHGDFLCISGDSGAGKSTLLNIMGLLERPDSGTVHVFGEQDVKPNTRTANKMLRHKIGFLFQNFGLIDDKSVSYNLDIACVKKKRWDKNKKRQLLEKLQLDVSLQEKVYHLSGGEQQRLAIARLLIKDCDLILADEPTGSLDVTNRNIVLDILSRLIDNGKTVVIVSHDPYVMERCQRVIELGTGTSPHLVSANHEVGASK